MALPKQVQKDIQDIEEFEKRVAAQQEEPKSETEEQPEETETVEESPKAEVEEPVEEEKPKEPTVSEVTDDFKQKYNTLRGKYDAEVPRLHQQVKELVAEVQALKEEKAKIEEAPPEPVSLITDEDKEEFGEDLINIARKAAKEEFQPLIESQRAEIASLKEQLATTGSQVTEVSFEQRLAQRVPDFARINQTPEWVEWLNEYDPMSRAPRRNLAQLAYQNGDVEAVADYVEMFKQTQQPKQDATEKLKEKRQNELERQVTPERNSTTTQTSTANDKRMYTKADADLVWNKVQDAMKNGDYDTADKLEAQITQAYLEGRVKQS